MTHAAVPVVHVITLLELGGAQQNTLETLARLDRARFLPQLVSGPGGMLDDEARALHDVPVHFVPELVRAIRPLRDMAAVSRVADLLRPLARQGPVIVHTHSSKAGIIGRLAAARARAGPVVHSIHGFGHAAVAGGPVRRAALALERRMARHTDAFLGVSRASIDEGRRLGLLGDRPAHLVRSGIDIGRYSRADSLRNTARSALGIPADAPVVGMIGNFKPQKAPLDFVDLAALVARGHPGTRFFIAGDGPLRSEVEARVRHHGLNDSLALLGWRHDIPELLGALDVLVLTSRWEGLPRVCPQAMAAGRPIVATAVDGIPEAVEHGRNGFLFAPGDVASGAESVLSLLGDTETRRRQGAAGRLAVAEFDVDLMIAGQERLYSELLRPHAGR